MEKLTKGDKGKSNLRPASGPKLGAAIDQALSQLADIAEWQGYGKDDWPEHAKLWRELLKQSKDRGRREVAPNLLKGELASPIGIKLTGRKWQSFENWFGRSIASGLLEISLESKIPALQAVRHANPDGGYADQSEAMFFLAFMEAAQASESSATADSQVGNSKFDGFIDNGQPASQSPLEPKVVIGGNQPTGLLLRLTQILRREGASPKSVITDGEVTMQRRWRFGVLMVLFGIFLSTFCAHLPADSRRWMFIAFSVVLFVLGIWDANQSNKGVPR